MGSDLTDDVKVVRAGNGGMSAYATSDSDAWADAQCGHCGAVSQLVIGHTFARGVDHVDVSWLRCPRCLRGSVVNGDVQSPPLMDFVTPDGLPKDESALWEQARSSLSVGAYAGVAMICRKLLLHVAHTHRRGVNPDVKAFSNFAQAVEYLENEHVILASHKLWVDQIRKLGNRANHELPVIEQDEARNIMQFTHQLFVNVYEMPAKANLENPLVGVAATPVSEGPEDQANS